MKNKPCWVWVHGASHGGWCWRILSDLAKPLDWDIHTPTLTGCGDRIHLLSKDLTIQTHIDDLKNFIYYQDLNDVILVGHSYAGFVIAPVVDALPDRIKKLVFLDSFLPENGKTGFEALGERFSNVWQLGAQNHGNGWLSQVSEKTPDRWGVTDAASRDFLLPRITDFSMNLFRTPIFLGDRFNQIEKTYIRCTKPSYCADLMLPFYKKAQQQKWQTLTINATHDCMVTEPEVVLDVFKKILI